LSLSSRSGAAFRADHGNKRSNTVMSGVSKRLPG
jgi:hypothetical protein